MNPLLWEELQRRGLVSAPGATSRADAASNAWTSVAQRYAPAIKGIESSGGNYTLLGSITKTGDRAYGAYQVMGKNIPGWTREATGKSMTPMEFLRNPQAQDAVFNHRFGEYVRKYGPEGAARAWYAGERGMNNPRATDMHGRLSVADYSREFTKRANAPPPAGQQSVQLGAQPQTPPATPASATASVPRPPANIPNTGLSGPTQAYVGKLTETFPNLQITSGHRSESRNAAVGGARGSQHLGGNAVDVSLKGLNDTQKMAVVDHALANGAKGIGYYPNSESVHVDFRQGAPAAWGPNYSKTSLPQTPAWFQERANAHLSGQTQVASAQPQATAASYAPTGRQAPGVAAIERATGGTVQGRAPAAAPARAAEGQTLGQRIIGGMGPRAKESLTTFVDKATGHEFISGSLDGQSYMFDVGKPSQNLGKAMVSAVRPEAKPAAAAPAAPAIEPAGPAADGPFPASPLPDLSGLNIDEGQRGALSRQPATSLLPPESTVGAYGDRYVGGPVGPTGSGWDTPPGEAPSWSNALSRPPIDMSGPTNTIAPGPLPQAGDAFLSPVSLANQPIDMSRSASSLPLSPFAPSRVTEGMSGQTMFAPAAAMQSTPQPQQQVATIPLGDMMAPWWWQQQGFGGEGFGGAWGTPGGLDFGGGTGGFEGGGGFGLGAFTAGGW